MKKHFAVITFLIISSSSVFAKNLQNESYFREYKDIKSDLSSEDIFKTQKRNLAIDWARDQCNQNDTNMGTTSCLSELSQDIKKQIDLKVAELESPLFNKSHMRWSAYVGAQCESVIGEFTGSIGPKLHADCLITLYREYLNVLDDFY